MYSARLLTACARVFVRACGETGTAVWLVHCILSCNSRSIGIQQGSVSSCCSRLCSLGDTAERTHSSFSAPTTSCPFHPFISPSLSVCLSGTVYFYEKSCDLFAINFKKHSTYLHIFFACSSWNVILFLDLF